MKAPTAHKPDWSPKVDPGLLLRSVACSGYFGAARGVRNSYSDSCDVAVKSGADLAKTKKGQVTFAAFDSTKITSV